MLITYNAKREFNTLTEAAAFVEGVEYANDSALEVVDTLLIGSEWVVFMMDEDFTEADVQTIEV